MTNYRTPGVYPCPRCKTWVPPWFFEQLYPLGGAFHVPMRQMGIFDSVAVPWEWEEGHPEFDGDPERRPAPLPPQHHPSPLASGGNGRLACYHCTNDWPYPEATEIEEDYTDRLRVWRRQQAEEHNKGT